MNGHSETSSTLSYSRTMSNTSRTTSARLSPNSNKDSPSRTTSLNFFSPKNPSRTTSLSIFNQVASRTRFLDFETALQKLTKVESTLTEFEENGLYCKTPRITMVHSKDDSLECVTASQLQDFLRNRSSSEHKGLGNLMWVDIQGEHSEMPDIAKVLNMHPLTLEDCTTADTREKIEMKNNYIYLVIQDVSIQGGGGINLNMIIYPDLLLTVHEKPVYSIYDVAKKLEYCENTEIPSIEFVVYVILSSVISFYDEHMDRIRQLSDSLDGRVLASTQVNKKETAELLGDLSHAIKRSSSLRATIAVKKDLFESLCRYDALFSAKGKQYIKGALNQILKMHLQIQLMHDTLEDIHELCMAKISVQLAVAGNQGGEVTRIFAIITVLFLPAGLVAGLIGMNVKLPALADPTQTNFGPFISIVCVMVGIALMQYMFFRGSRWL